jgi:RNA polymerase sigma-70 factor (ECF subfamily)
VNDLELVAAAKQGDQIAFTELYHRHIDDVRTVCGEIIPLDDIDDVCQETFSKAFKGVKNFRGDAQFGTWLISIARNECFRVKKNRMRPTKGSFYLVPLVDVDEYGEEREVNHVPECKKQFEDVEVRVDLAKRLSSLDQILPPRSRRVVRDVIGGATVSDIARTQGVPLKTVESRFARILRKIEKNILPK